MPMQAVSFKRHRFPPDVIRHAVCLYFHFTLSLRGVEEMACHRFGNCPFQKLYPAVLMVKSAQDVGCNDGSAPLDGPAIG